jgi:fido (protein-threonine AMPylation protein)
LLKQGQIRKIAPRIYTANLTEEPGTIVKRNILLIIGTLFPGSVLSHRSAFEYKPTDTGDIFVTYSYTKKMKLPGVTINFLEGKGAIDGDNKFYAELYASQKERAFLENLQITKKMGASSKVLSLPEIEEKLEKILVVHEEAGLNKLRDRARVISKELDMEKEFDKLNKIIGALLSSKPYSILTSPIAISRAIGAPYDSHRIEIFEELFRYLKNQEFPFIHEKNKNNNAFRNFAFFEAYFSNYIEGTVFLVEEAKKIIDTNMPLPSRDDDSHDILGTYQLVSSRNEMKIIPESGTMLANILQQRHRILLSSRVSKKPGEFKETDNRAGNTIFVTASLVRGTLLKGYEIYQALDHPFARASFLMFMISEVHPFNDGNGRIARVMMNAELVNQDQTKIIIPTVFRDDYLLSLKKLTNTGNPEPYVNMLLKVQRFSDKLNFDDFNEMHQYLISCNAFYEPDEGRRLIV